MLPITVKCRTLTRWIAVSFIFIVGVIVVIRTPEDRWGGHYASLILSFSGIALTVWLLSTYITITEQKITLHCPPFGSHSIAWTELKEIAIRCSGKEIRLIAVNHSVIIGRLTVFGFPYLLLLLLVLTAARKQVPTVLISGLEDVLNLRCSCGCDLRNAETLMCLQCGRDMLANYR
jgi:hypothetical protein